MSSLWRSLRRIPLLPLPPLPWGKLFGRPESAERKAWMKATEERGKKDEASGTVRKKRIETQRVTNLGPLWDTMEEDNRQS